MEGGNDKFELYRQCLPKRVKDTEIKELGKFECLSFVTTIAPVLKIDQEKWVPWESSWKLMMLFMYESVLYIHRF